MPRKLKRGSALLICMLLLTALTLLGLAAVSDAGLQNRMIGNQHMARHVVGNAHASLRWAEAWLLGLEGAVRPPACSGTCEDGQVIRSLGVYPASPEHEDDAWWQANGFHAGHDPVSGIVLDSALAAFGATWIMEEIHYAETGAEEGVQRGDSYYRIISRAAHPTVHQVAVVESVLARPWGDSSWSDNFPPATGQSAFCRQPEAPSPCGRTAWQIRR